MLHVEILLWPDGAPLAKGTTPEDSPAITPYLVEGKNNSAIIICPGGGYARRAHHEGEPVAKWLNSIGISAFVLRYRVAPYQYPCALLDIQRAIRMVRYRSNEYGINPNKLGALGFSAGGHVVATAGTTFDTGDKNSKDPIDKLSSRPELLILCYPVITMREPFLHSGSKDNLIGSTPDEELLKKVCNDERVTVETPPTFLWHTSDDASVPVGNSLLFAQELNKNKVLFDLHVFAKGRHGLGLADGEEHVSTWTNPCTTWLKFNNFV
ncbi:alpha/beta hydrolase [Evansella sp. AB-P1]|uniref:alpha/beta hydrolase n=1 Tax=Evansella sp. AB-P1 TaxID=3037653 RepID=UPI0024201873|nr:alpha/beta hydrolase [Evansella sp. AB-P1]MDG5787895.1 alpha/beta hydrolase [Evansella sp. AB-P1]